MADVRILGAMEMTNVRIAAPVKIMANNLISFPPISPEVNPRAGGQGHHFSASRA